MKKIFTLITLLVMGIGGAWAEDQVLNANVSATYINAGNGDTNYSEAGVLYANFSKIDKGVLTNQLSAYGGSDITIVKFDASALPSGATIKSANVTFTSQCTVSGKNSQLAIVPINTDWTASEATWNNVDKSATSSQVVNLAFSSTTATSQTYDAKDILNADADKIVAFAIFTNTGRQQKVTNLALTVTYTEEALNNRNYTVNAVCGSTVLKQLATGSALENENFKVSSLPYIVMKDGVCYKLDDAAVSGYSKSFTMPAGSGAVTNTVSYSVCDITYFFEAESILSKSYGNGVGAYSSGTTAGVYTGATLTMPSIAAGVYTVTVNTSVRRANEDIFTVQVSTDGTNWTDTGTITLTSNVAGDYSAENITLLGNGSIRLVEAKSQNMCHYVDYVLIQKTGDIFTKTIGDTGFGTFSAAVNVAVPAGVTVYNTTLDGETLTATPNTEATVIAANTGVIVKGEAGQTYTYESTTEAGSAITTALTAAPNGVTGDGTTTFGLLRASMEFAIINDGVALPANYAYLVIPTSTPAKINFVVNDTTTAISTVNAAPATTNSAAYNLAGQRVNANAKGVVIINGKKYINK